MAKAVVTGGAGFIGSHLAERLLDDGHEVIVLDNFSTGSMENLSRLIGKASFHLRRLDVTAHEELEVACSGADWFFHLAALADIVPSIETPLEYHRVNVDGTVNVLEAARTAKVSKFIYAASSSCYGITEVLPTPETAPIKPRYPYALTKYIGEQYVMHWGEVYDLPVISLRLFNVYGPRARTSGAYGAVFGVFLAQKLNHKPLTVVGDGNQSRDFVFIDDVVNAFIMVTESSVSNEVFNVGSGEPQRVNRIVELLGSEKVHVPKRPGEPDCTHADISKIKRLVKWKPKVAFTEGVNTLLKNIDYWKDAPVWTPESIDKATNAWFRYLGKG
jgi:UDP-glucose 4-epimerase